mmetsp:Transcript_7030/g.21334  ORF Transcript_7030/g.21334 Transcript_7030/m.21334 type:complete len:225 (-) Transcript_7030:417-1091(-)
MACHLPLYAGLLIFGASHFPQPTLHTGFSMMGASHSPSSSSSQSSGIWAVGSGILAGSSSLQPEGMVALGSAIIMGASSSQSSGLVDVGSSILASSIQSVGLESAGSSISFGGFTGGSMEVKRLPEAFISPSIAISKELSGLTTRRYRCVSWSCGTPGGSLKCFSSSFPVLGLRCCRIKWTLSVPPHLSGPNIMTYGVLSLNLRASIPSLSKSLMYDPPHDRPS